MKDEIWIVRRKEEKPRPPTTGEYFIGVDDTISECHLTGDYHRDYPILSVTPLSREEMEKKAREESGSKYPNTGLIFKAGFMAAVDLIFGEKK